MYYLYILLFLSTSIYATEIDVRGYQFGESYSTILNSESKKKEFKPLSTKTNNNRLAYSGVLFNKPVSVVFNFRNQRLSSLSYMWENLTNETLFYKHTRELLQNKYIPYQTKTIPAKNSRIDNSSYVYQTTNINTNDNTTNINNLLYINLENITLSNDIQTLILEFQAFDSDKTIKNKVLLEDI